MKGRLNIFQRTMLDWDELHPYNAVHVARITGTLDLNRLAGAVHTTLETRGLTNLTLNRSRGMFEYAGGPTECDIKLITGPGVSPEALTLEIEYQLNTAFRTENPFIPFRFVVAPGPDSFSFAVVYLHAVADAESIIGLVMGIVAAYTRRNEPGQPGPLQLCGTHPDCLLPRHPVLLARLLTAMPRQVRIARYSCRPHYHEVESFRNGFSLVSLPCGSLSALLKTARNLDVTLNDLFLALLMKSVAPLAANRTTARRRRKIALGSIVNIRKDVGADNGQSFGLFLGSFLVAHEVSDHTSTADLVRQIRRETLRIKERKLYLATSIQLAVARAAFHLFSTKGRRKFYQKHYPLWGGITNVDLNPLCGERDTSMLIDYFRAVSTGPATPMVLSVTTARGAVNLGLSYRTTVFSTVEIERVKGFLVNWEMQFQGWL